MQPLTPHATSEERSWGAAVTYLLGAVFFGALGLGVVTAPMDMHPALGWLLRGFIGLLFGSLSLAALLSAFRSLRPHVPAPAELLARCLCCGERTPEGEPCPCCGLSSAPRVTAVQTQPGRWPDALLMSMGATGVACLGAFVAVGPYVDGERRVWVLAAMGALALLLLLVGAAGSVGALVDGLQRLRDGAEVRSHGGSGAWRFHGSGTVRRGDLARFEGSGVHREGLAESHEGPQGYRASADTRLAEVLATFEAAGLWVYTRETSWCWVLSRGRDGFALQRTDARCVQIEPGAPPQGELDAAVAGFLWRITDEAITLASLREMFDASSDLRAQCEAHAASLREAGLRVLPRRVAALQRALDAAGGHGAA